MADFTTLMQAPLRKLQLRGRITFAGGVQAEITGADVVQLCIEEGCDGALLPGSVLSAGFTLDLANDHGQWLPGGERLGYHSLPGAEIALEIGVLDGEDMLWQPLGMFAVESALQLESEALVRLSGADGISHALSAAFKDGLSYPASLEQLWRNAVSQAGYAFSGEVPNGSAVIDSLPEWKDASLRTALGHIAAAAGCFVRLDRSGGLMLCRAWDKNEPYALHAGNYMKLECDSAGFGPVDSLHVIPSGGDGTPKSYYAGGTQAGLYAVSVSENPLFRADAPNLDALCEGMLAEIAGYRSVRARFDWRGDPALAVGRRIALTDTSGRRIEGVLCRQTLRYAAGFSASCMLDLPAGDGTGIRRILTADGGVNAGALVGQVDGALLKAGSVTAEKIAAGAVTAQAIEAVEGRIHELVSEDITTDRLYADLAAIASAQITEANIEKANIDWANIDTLNANIADISLAKIQTADIDFAKVKDLMTDTAIITEGVGGQLYIARLAVTEANMVQLTVGSLMLKAGDGSFVRLIADGSGGVTTQKVEVEGGNIANATISGTNLIENTITARELNVEKIFADTALIRAIKAANIDVADLFAAQATIEQLDSWIISANTIKALEGALDIWASEKINIAVGDLDLTTAENVQNSSVTITPGMVQIETPVFSVQNESTGMTLDEEGLSAEYVSAPNLAERYIGKAGVTVGSGASADVKLTAANFSEYFDIVNIYSGYNLSTAGGNLRLIPNNLGEDSTDAICTITAKKALAYMEIWFRCKSESGYDTLYGNCNNATIISTVSGDHAYQRAWYGSVSANDTFTFTYHKDNSTSVSGEEVYIDFISIISAGSGAEGDYKSLAALASELNGRLLTQDLTVTLVSDVTGGAEFANIAGGKITINGNGHSMNNPLSIRSCSTLFEISNLNFSYTAKGHARYENCTVLLRSCVFNVASGTEAEPALFITNGARVNAVNTEFYNTIGNLLVLTNMAYCALEDCAGYANRTTTMQVLGGSQLRACGTYPAGSVYGGPSDTASVVELNGTASSGSAQAAPSTLTEQSFTCTSSDTCRGSSNWDGSGYIWQGYTSSGVHRGYMWFSGLASAISGKTIVSATLKLTRVNGIGRSGATALYAYYTTKTAASGTQSVSTAYGGELGSIGNEETKTFDLPAEIIQRIADNASGGIALYSGESSSMEGRNYSRNYCKLYGAGSEYAPVLTVTYQ